MWVSIGECRGWPWATRHPSRPLTQTISLRAKDIAFLGIELPSGGQKGEREGGCTGLPDGVSLGDSDLVRLGESTVAVGFPGQWVPWVAPV